MREVGLLAHHLADDVAFPADGSDDAFFQVAFASASHALLGLFLAQWRLFALAADIGLVNFEDPDEFLKLIIIHRGADTRHIYQTVS